MAKVEIDNVKMWESIILRLNNVEDGVYKTFIIDALQDQGLEFKCGHIISKAEQKHEDSKELTEFEKELKVFFDDYTYFGQKVAIGEIKETAQELLSIARKQIAEEISIDMFCSNIGYVNGIYTGHDMDNAYRLGAVDMLNKIKEG